MTHEETEKKMSSKTYRNVNMLETHKQYTKQRNSCGVNRDKLHLAPIYRCLVFHETEYTYLHHLHPSAPEGKKYMFIFHLLMS